MRILTRYLFAEALLPLLGSLFAFLFLWIIYDMFDNFSDFIEAKAPAALIFQFYLEQVPRAIAIGLPIAVLLACLYSLIQLSRNTELIAMQACGVSIFEIGKPFLILGLTSTALLIWLNWEWNPQAVRNRELIMDKFKDMREKAALKRDQRNVKQRLNMESLIYRSKDTKRIWFIHKSDIASWRLTNVEILQLSEEGNDLWKYYINLMKWDGKTWRLTDALKIRYDEKGNAVEKDFYPTHKDPVLRETFSQVTSTMRAPEVLSVPELNLYLKENLDLGAQRTAPFATYYYYRLAIGFACMATVLLALPYGISASRRDLFAGFGRSIVLYFIFLTFTHFCLAMGKGSRIAPWIAGTFPVIAFLGLGLFLFIRKCHGIEAPNFREMGEGVCRVLSFGLIGRNKRQSD